MIQFNYLYNNITSLYSLNIYSLNFDIRISRGNLRGIDRSIGRNGLFSLYFFEIILINQKVFICLGIFVIKN